MAERIYVTPKEGLTVPDENGTPIPPEGISVELTTYIRKRLRAGELTQVDADGLTAQPWRDLVAGDDWEIGPISDEDEDGDRIDAEREARIFWPDGAIENCTIDEISTGYFTVQVPAADSEDVPAGLVATLQVKRIAVDNTAVTILLLPLDVTVTG